MKMYKIKFYRINTYTKPMLRQETDVVFRTDFSKGNEEFDKAMFKAMWNQCPAWLLPHGPIEINFGGWSSVMYENDSLEEVELERQDIREDLTGNGNMVVPMTYHPFLPDDLRVSLKKAYERGEKNGKYRAKL